MNGKPAPTPELIRCIAIRYLLDEGSAPLIDIAGKVGSVSTKDVRKALVPINDGKMLTCGGSQSVYQVRDAEKLRQYLEAREGACA
jgi:hypothetical protein